MNTGNKNLNQAAPTGAPASVPTEHAVMPVPFTVMQAITNYLTKQPYNEVVQFLNVLAQIQAVDKRKIPTEG